MLGMAQFCVPSGGMSFSTPQGTKQMAPETLEGTSQDYRLLPEPTKESLAAIRAEIERIGQVRPGQVLMDELGNVIVGHAILTVARELTLPCYPESIKYGEHESAKWYDALKVSFKGCHLTIVSA